MSDDLVTFSEADLAEFFGEDVVTDTISETTAPTVRERVTVHNAAPGRGYLLRAPADWTWEDLRDYVVTQILRVHGPFPRNERKEYGIFKNFAVRYGADAGPIAKHAFEQLDGIWMGSPTRVERFTKGCDAYFADEILTRLRAAR